MKDYLLSSLIAISCCLASLCFAPPAARLTDFHQRPMQTPVVVNIPHVGGPILASPNALLPSSQQQLIGNTPIPKTGILLQDDPRLHHSLLPQAVIIKSSINQSNHLAMLHQTPLGPVIKPFPH